MKTVIEIAIEWCPNSDSYFAWELHNAGKCCEFCAKLCDLIQEVTEAERERCAKIAEDEGCGEWSCGVDIAKAIRETKG